MGGGGGLHFQIATFVSFIGERISTLNYRQTTGIYLPLEIFLLRYPIPPSQRYLTLSPIKSDLTRFINNHHHDLFFRCN